MLVLKHEAVQADAVVIGAGVVGLAVARELAAAGREVLILEAASAFGSGTSSRSSEVLHAGLYYPTGSLKARLCVQGRPDLVDYARSRGVPHGLCGKLVVASDDSQMDALHRLHRQAQDNGVPGLQLLEGFQARALEPALRASAALHSTVTGIIDSHALMTALLGDAQSMGAQLVLRSPVLGGEVQADGSIELVVGGQEPVRLLAQAVVNAAGLNAVALARAVQGVPVHSVPQAHRCKGHYFGLRGRSPFSRLIYPLHTAAGLGTHLTLDLGGQARFGPDVQWLPSDAADAGAVHPGELDIDYAVDAARAAAFEADVRRYWPGLPAGALEPAYSGVRPKIVGPQDPAGDFLVSAPAQHGVRGWVALYGIESPGLTACLALARAVLQAFEAAS